MNWQEIIISIVSIILTALISWAVERLVAWINVKIKNTKYAKLVGDAITVVGKVVKCITQTYVDSLKGKNAFDELAQVEALEKAKAMASEQIPQETQKYIESNFGSFDAWLVTEIESSILDQKKK